jgi:hypothetical protein
MPGNNPKSPEPDPFKFQAHPAERRRGKDVVVCCCGCCCCCCCCLHSLGSLVGAAAVVSKTAKPGHRSVALMYWIVLAVLTIGTFAYYGERQEASLVIIALAMPLIQLAAAVVTAVGVVLFGQDTRSELVQVGKITVWTILGALIGIGVMWPLFGFLW